MAEYKGSSVVLEFAGTDISGSARTVTISEDPGEPEKIDVTVKGDTERQHLESFPGADNTTVTMNALALDASDTIEAVATNTTGNVVIYPEGKTQGSVSVTINSMRLINKEYTIPYDGAVEWNVTFNSTTGATYGTYNSAA
jgi:hypothetical protein